MPENAGGSLVRLYHQHNVFRILPRQGQYEGRKVVFREMVETTAGYKHLRVLAAPKATLDTVKLLEGASVLRQPFLYALKENRLTVRARTVFSNRCTKHHTAHHTHFGSSKITAHFTQLTRGLTTNPARRMTPPSTCAMRRVSCPADAEIGRKSLILAPP